MDVTINSWTTDVHAHGALVNGAEFLFATSKTVGNIDGVLLKKFHLCSKFSIEVNISKKFVLLVGVLKYASVFCSDGGTFNIPNST